jgi:phytoene dehydrogenase-like protein
VADDGRATFAHRDPERTAAEFAHAEDRSVYLAMLQRLGENMASIAGLLGSEVRSLAVVRHASGLARSGGLRGAEWWLRAAVTSGRAYLRRDFRGHEVDHLYAPWLLHAGLSPDHAAGGLMTPLFAGILHGFGLPVVAGGAGRFVVAFRSLLGSLGVRVETGFEVDRILVEHGRAVGVEAAGRTLRARRAVLASVTPGALYGRLLPEDAVDSALRAEAARFRHGRAAMQIHVALSEPLGWRNPRLAEIPLIHLSDGSAGTGIACAEAEAGLLPRHPTVVWSAGSTCWTQPGCPRAPLLCGCSCRRCRTRPVATRPGNSTRRTAGPRRWPRDIPTACSTGSHGTLPICATRSARSTS